MSRSPVLHRPRQRGPHPRRRSRSRSGSLLVADNSSRAPSNTVALIGRGGCSGSAGEQAPMARAHARAEAAPRDTERQTPFGLTQAIVTHRYPQILTRRLNVRLRRTAPSLSSTSCRAGRPAPVSGVTLVVARAIRAVRNKRRRRPDPWPHRRKEGADRARLLCDRRATPSGYGLNATAAECRRDEVVKPSSIHHGRTRRIAGQTPRRSSRCRLEGARLERSGDPMFSEALATVAREGSRRPYIQDKFRERHPGCRRGGRAGTTHRSLYGSSRRPKASR